MKFRKIIILLLCVFLALPLIACNTDGRGDGNNGRTYTVTFDIGDDARAAGAVNPEPRDVVSGGTLDGFPIVTGYTGYGISGWFYADGRSFDINTPITANITIFANWVTEAELSEAAKEYENKIPTWSESGHLYIHYKRGDHVQAEESVKNTGAPDYNNAIKSTPYGDWGLWLWPKNNEGRLFNAAWIDVSGAVYDILLDHTYNDFGWDADNKVHKGLSENYIKNNDIAVTDVGMQLFQISTRLGKGYWANDGGNNYLTLEDYKRADGSYHVFVSQGSVGTPTKQFTAEEVVDPYLSIPKGSATTRTNGDKIIDSTKVSTYSVWNKRVTDYDNVGTGYQIFIASFKDSNGDGMGDLRGIIEELDYLKSLNIDVLWLTPFQTSTNYHGYDIDDYFSVDKKFGTAADYRELVDKAHDKGMKIVMDFVLNHTSQANTWYVKSQNLIKEKAADGTEIDYRQFYTWINETQYNAILAKDAANGMSKDEAEATGLASHWHKDAYNYYYYSSFGSSMPELNYDYQPVRDAILDVCFEWMKYGLDGFRLDAVKHIYMVNEVEGKGNTVSPGGAFASGKKDYGYVNDDDIRFAYDAKRNFNFYREFNYRLKSKYPNAFVVGENLDGWDERVAPFAQGIDSQFDFSQYYNVSRGLVGASGAGGDNTWIRNVISFYNRGKTHYDKYNPNYIGGVFTSNHDLSRARDRLFTTTDSKDEVYKPTYTNGTVDGKPVDPIYDKNNQLLNTPHPGTGTLDPTYFSNTETLLRLYYASLFTQPGITWLYYGDEIGMSGVMQYTLDTGSTSSTASADHEDRIFRQPMKWEATGNASYSIGYNTYKCELTGFNASSTLKSVAEQKADQNSLWSFTQKLTQIRKEKGLNMGTVTVTNNSGGTVTYRVQGSKGGVEVTFVAGGSVNTSGALLAYNGTANGTQMGVAIKSL